MDVDDAGRTLRLDAPPRRIVSLVPSLTELLFALGAGDAVVGVTRYCTDPAPRVATLPKLGGTKNPELGAIAAMAPDLIIMNAEENRREDFEALVGAGFPVYVTEPKTVDDGIRLIARLGALVGHGDAGARLAATQRAGVATVRARAGGHRDVRYFCPIWRKPWMAFNADTYAHDVLRVAGGRNLLAAHAARYPEVTLPEVAALRPEIVLLPNEPYPFGPRDLPALAALEDTPALRGNHVRFVDGKALSWYGVRIADAVDIFARLLAESVAS